MLGELTKDQVMNVLGSQVVGRMACCDQNQPYIVPVTYAIDGDYIYGQLNEGRKLNIIRQNPKVCFEVDMMTDMANWQSVLVFGEVEILNEKDAEAARKILFGKVLTLMTSSTLHSHEHEVNSPLDDDNRVKRYMYRIPLKECSGRFERQQ
jgi:nitroimidazol reductase NimA-like FMN-containing flavoprotein (pyridoxamine 5'-phosphate oxidase superfamily)